MQSGNCTQCRHDKPADDTTEYLSITNRAGTVYKIPINDIRDISFQSGEPEPIMIKKNHRVVWQLNDLPHRRDGPAVITSKGIRRWFLHGILHRDPDKDGYIGPAIEHPNGTQYYYWYGKLHRWPEIINIISKNQTSSYKSLPSVILPNGTREYYFHGVLHRIDGPAREVHDNTGKLIALEFWIQGKRVNNMQYSYY